MSVRREHLARVEMENSREWKFYTKQQQQSAINVLVHFVPHTTENFPHCACKTSLLSRRTQAQKRKRDIKVQLRKSQPWSWKAEGVSEREERTESNREWGERKNSKRAEPEKKPEMLKIARYNKRWSLNRNLFMKFETCPSIPYGCFYLASSHNLILEI